MAHPPDQLQYTFSTRMFFEGDFTVTHSSCMIVVSTVDYSVTRRGLTTDLVCHHNIVNPHVLRPKGDTVQTAVGATTDSHVVDFAVLASIDGKVEGRGVDQGNIMNSKITDIVQPEKTRTADRAGLVEFEAVALAFAKALKIVDLPTFGRPTIPHLKPMRERPYDKKICL